MSKKLEIIPGWEVIKRISEAKLQKGDQYRRLNNKYPHSIFTVGVKYDDELMPNIKSFCEDKFVVLKEEYKNSLNNDEKEIAIDEFKVDVKEEALKVAASYSTREQFKKYLFEPRQQCPSDYGMMDFCGQRCKDCINQALSECTVTFVGD